MISLGYLAGFVDGEGYLALAKICRRGRLPEYCARLVVYNTNREVLSLIQRSWGGTMSAVASREANWKPGYALIWTNAAAANLLQDLAPHLRVKARQADALLRFQEHVRNCPRRRRRDGSLSSLAGGERMRREYLFQRMKELNTRDPAIRKTHVGRRRLCGSKAPSPRYLAGFIDGEGSLMIVKSRVGGQARLEYRARVAVANTDRHVLDDIRRVYGGILVGYPPQAVGWNPGFQLVWTEGMLPRILPVITPHLRIKQNQARLLSDFVRHKGETRQDRRGKYFARLPDEVNSVREAYRLRMAQLNAKGMGPRRVVGLNERARFQR